MSYDLSCIHVVDVSARMSPYMIGTLPHGYQRQGMVLHATACPSVGGSSLEYLLSRHSPTSSSDQLIARDGTIYQLVPDGHFAYHSGPAVWEGFHDEEGGLNMAYYGVEIENTSDGREPYTREQIVAAAATYTYKCALHKWPTDRRIAAHSWVAIYKDDPHHHDGDLGRKSDPFRFPWGEFWHIVWNIRSDWPVREWPGVGLWIPPQR